MRLWLLVLASGCWRGTDAPTTFNEPLPPAAPVALVPHGVSCDQVATNVQAILKDGPDPVLAGRADALRDTVLTHCRVDRWSAELRGCLACASSLETLQDCEDLATSAQQEALDQDIAAIEDAE